MKRAACCIALVLAGCSRAPVAPVTLAFPDFPENVADMDLGQSLTFDVETANDNGLGVTWTCKGEACAPLQTTPGSVTFKAGGITGKAVLVATSKKQPEVTRQIRINVKLNDSPDMLCK
jgi:hypothetical protein